VRKRNGAKPSEGAISKAASTYKDCFLTWWLLFVMLAPGSSSLAPFQISISSNSHGTLSCPAFLRYSDCSTSHFTIFWSLNSYRCCDFRILRIYDFEICMFPTFQVSVVSWSPTVGWWGFCNFVNFGISKIWELPGFWILRFSEMQLSWFSKCMISWSLWLCISSCSDFLMFSLLCQNAKTYFEIFKSVVSVNLQIYTFEAFINKQHMDPKMQKSNNFFSWLPLCPWGWQGQTWA
jgi:hypothetical protein